MENTIRSRTKTNKKHNSHTKRRRKYEKALESERDGYWDSTRAKERKAQEVEYPKPKEYKADVFQRVFQAITVIIRELWLERNTDRH